VSDASRTTTVGVVGAGTIGTGVAQSLAASGHRVILLDVSEEILARAKRAIERSVRLLGMTAGGPGAASPAETMARIECTTHYAPFTDCGFVVENATEMESVKRDVYGALDLVCPPETVFAANTSCIPITRIAGWTARPGRVLGMHFMNPVPLKPVVETVRGVHTTDETLAIALRLLSAMGKEGIVVNDGPGFVANRVLMLAINEAAWTVMDGVAPPEDVDRLFVGCFGHAMGPLATGDLIGLDTIVHSLQVLQESFGDPKFRPCPLLRRMVDAGHLGRKSGRGFFDYGA
jgi:3-hydroxybutyryl-CoA dehydrogenase